MRYRDSGHRPFECNAWKGSFWFRLFGYGLAVERDMQILFSERVKARRVLRIGRYAFQTLRPSMPQLPRDTRNEQ